MDADTQSWIELSRSAVQHNLELLSTKAGSLDRLFAIIKGNAYGHGLEQMGPLLSALGVQQFAVFQVQEAYRLRSLVPQKNILLLGAAMTADIPTLIEQNIDLTFFDEGQLELWWTHRNMPLRLHIKVDTGMHRFGLASAQVPSVVQRIRKDTNWQIIGLSSHYANSWETAEPRYLETQKANFMEAVDWFDQQSIDLEYIHQANTAAVFTDTINPRFYYRSGISLCGYYPTAQLYADALASNQTLLQPVLTWKTRIISLKSVSRNAAIGYDLAYRMPDNGQLALIPIGYYDGYPFLPTEAKVHVLIQGKKIPVVGRVNMNCLILKMEHLVDAKLLDEVILLGGEKPDAITCYDWIAWGAPHLYAALTNLKAELPRIIVS